MSERNPNRSSAGQRLGLETRTILTHILELRMINSGALETQDSEIRALELYNDIKYAKDTWKEPSSTFDKAVRYLMVAVIQEYEDKRGV